MGQSRFDRRCIARALRVVAALGLAVCPMAAIASLDLARTVYASPIPPFLTSAEYVSRNSVDLAGLVIPSARQGWWRLIPAVESWNDYLRDPSDFSRGFRAMWGGSIAYVGVVTLILAAIGAARRLRGSALVWLALAGAGLAMALGPDLHVHGAVSRSPWLPMPYRLLSALIPESLARMFRSPYPFMAVVELALWVLAARGIAWLRARLGPGTPRIASTAVLAVWLVGEHAYAAPAANRVGLTPWMQRIAQDERAVSVLEMPTSNPFALEVYSFRQALHGKPIGRGYLARVSATVVERDRQLNAIGRSSSALAALLAEMGPSYVVVHPKLLATE